MKRIEIEDVLKSRAYKPSKFVKAIGALLRSLKSLKRMSFTRSVFDNDAASVFLMCFFNNL